jgi:hypothetical protein
MNYGKEEMKEHGMKVKDSVNAKAMGEDRSFGAVGSDNPHDIMRGGGSDPRRPQAKILIERKIVDHDQSGYNHAYTPDSDAYAKVAERKAMGMGTPHPDGTYSR